ncbi:hypothetical protein ACFPYI_14110 [Halomarina salina]|uniref:Uncharacterized protein n=1 Tax=Halomarina salina TaxID=1872699 RepID=A0ABD5RPK4_9EURY|nr:hypothetical protein [Halomarina salina]
MNRRTLLASLGTVGMAGVAGCHDGIVSGEPMTTLRRFGVINSDETSGHTYVLRIERDEMIVHESTHEVEAAEDGILPRRIVDCDWEAVPGTYTVSARVDGESWQTFDVLDRYDTVPECVVAVVVHEGQSDESGGLRLRVRDRCEEFAYDPRYCSADTSTPEGE